MHPTIKSQLMALHSACQSLGIEPENNAEQPGQAFLAFSKRDAGRIVSHCFARWGWSPTIVLMDKTLPAIPKGQQWLGTDAIEPLTPMRALNMLYGMTPVETARDAEALIAWAEDNPEQLTNGEALRGLAMVRRHLADERYPEA
jgi:hypothetical protein